MKENAVSIDPRRSPKISFFNSADHSFAREIESASAMPERLKIYQEIRGSDFADSPSRSSGFGDDRESDEKRVPAWNPASFAERADSLCLNDPAFQESLRSFAKFNASRSDEFMLSGPPLTACECARCREVKGKRSWGERRRTQMAISLKTGFVESAREANPNAILSFVLPSDFDSYRAQGLDVVALSQLFDRLFIRSSSRGDAISMPGSRSVETFLWFRWLAELTGKKAWGILSDRDQNAGAESPDAALAEATLAGVKEVAFALDEKADREAMLVEAGRLISGSLSELASAAHRTPIRGIAAYRPPNETASRSTDSLFALHACGFPLRPTPRFPSSSKVALFDSRSFADRNLPAQLSEYLRKGGIACLSTALLDDLKAAGWTEADSPSLRVWDDMSSSASESATARIERLRSDLLEPFGVRFDGSPGITLHLFGFADAVAFNGGESSGEFALDFTGKSLRLAATSDEALAERIGGESDAWILNPGRWALFRTG